MNYYLINKTMLVKGSFKKGDNLEDKAWKFDDGEWIDIPPYVINDRLIGYDPTEDDYYSIGNSDIMKEIEKITEEEAMEIVGRG